VWVVGGLTKPVLESPLEGELTEYLGYDPCDPAGRHSGKSRNDTRKTVLNEVGPIELEVSRDRAGSFEPVPKRPRRLNGVDALVWSTKGLTHGEICAHMWEIYGAEMSKESVTASPTGSWRA
jgi:transposase-like protein